jgi:YfiH family protein
LVHVFKNAPDKIIEGDGFVTQNQELALTIHTADCIPAVASQGKFFGAVHGGWRGVASGILYNWVEVFKKEGADISQLEVVLGPAIGVCHFEVGKDVAEQIVKSVKRTLTKQELDQILVKHPDPAKKFVNLKRVAQIQLMQAGVKQENITDINECTYCNTEKFHSYRRNGKQAGRLEALIYLDSKAK